MGGNVTTWDRIAWDFICAKLSESKRRVSNYNTSTLQGNNNRVY